jgi:CRISPR-associated protein Cmr6
MNEPPMMYRSQARCSLQFVTDEPDNDLQKWLKEWIEFDSTADYPFTEKTKPLGNHGNIFRVKVSFSYRVFSNCGQDSIHRPTIGKNGIPFIPGSSVKGLFKRACSPEQWPRLCGTGEKSGKIRFHGAYPLNHWAPKVKAIIRRDNQDFQEVRYLCLDITHPQQSRQVERQESTTAIAHINFHKPTLVFEFSSQDPNIDWSEVENILKESLREGLGGKTNCGYGFANNKKLPKFTEKKETIHFNLQGGGVSSSLLAGEVITPRNWSGSIPKGEGESEFRPQMFKGSLRSHISRLLAGASGNRSNVESQVKSLFQLDQEVTNSNNLLRFFWESSGTVRHPLNPKGRNHRYETRGVLHLYAPSTSSEFINYALKFAYAMGGFGKSWRRTSHLKFMNDYDKNKFAIGCHWETTDQEWLGISCIEDLSTLLDNVHRSAKQLLSSSANEQYIHNWREAWHPSNVEVYSVNTSESQIIHLFHNDIFKFTPAVGGKAVGDSRPTAVSSVWHRMLPIDHGKYLEIVTVFKQGNWNHSNEGNIRQRFLQQLTNSGLSKIW